MAFKKKLRYRIDPETGCWVWLLCINTDGYAQQFYKGKTTTVHKLYYEMVYGEVPEGFELDHTCKNRRCVNPEHMEVVTHTENIRRSSRTKLTLVIAGKIRDLFSQGWTKLALSNKFGVSRRQIKRIVEHFHWKEDPSELTPVSTGSVGSI